MKMNEIEAIDILMKLKEKISEEEKQALNVIISKYLETYGDYMKCIEELKIRR